MTPAPSPPAPHYRKTIIKTTLAKKSSVTTIFETLSKIYDVPTQFAAAAASSVNYRKLQAVGKFHANFVDFLGLVKTESSIRTTEYVLLTRPSISGNADLTLHSFIKFNRHALRLRRSFVDDSSDLAAAAPTSLLAQNSASPTYSPATATSPFSTQSYTTHTDEVNNTLPPLIGFNPILDGEADAPARFLFYQSLRAVQFLHDNSITHGSLAPEEFVVTDDMWIELRPPTGVHSSSAASPSSASPLAYAFNTINDTELWYNREISNLEYLLRVNFNAGRRSGGRGAYHALVPWVVDFSKSPDFSKSHDIENYEKRDLTKSKFRLKKGDAQLEATFRGAEFGSSLYKRRELPHHVPESLSELTYYVYAARCSPIRALQRVVRQNFEPKEYPSSMARLYEWTPDECVPEFYLDCGFFNSVVFDASVQDHDVPVPNNGMNCLLCSRPKSMHTENRETLDFLAAHRAALASCDDNDLASWIDLNFGAALQGRCAVENMNVVLLPPPRVLNFFQLRKSPGFLRVFDKPHPTRDVLQSQHIKPRVAHSLDEAFLRDVFQAMLAPRGGLKVKIQEQIDVAEFEPKSTFLGSDLVEWLVRRAIPGVTTAKDAVILAQKLMAARYFCPERTGADEDFVDAEEVYRFLRDREAAARRGNKAFDIAVSRASLPASDVARNLAKAGVHGSIRVGSYYPVQSLERTQQDAVALGLIFAQVYLGRPAQSELDLDELPSAVRLALRTLVSGRGSIKSVLSDRNLFPAHFEIVYDFMAKTKLTQVTNPVDEFCFEFAKSFHRIKNHRTKQEAATLAFPLAFRFMRSESFKRIGQVYAAMRDIADDAQLKALVETALANPADAAATDTASLDSTSATGSSMTHINDPEWTRQLPVDVFLEKFVDWYVTSGGTSKAAEKALASLGTKTILTKIAPLILLRVKASFPGPPSLSPSTSGVSVAQPPPQSTPSSSHELFVVDAKDLVGRLLSAGDKTSSSALNNSMTSSSRKLSLRDLKQNEEESSETEEDVSENDDELNNISMMGVGGGQDNFQLHDVGPASAVWKGSLLSSASQAFKRGVASRFLAHADSPVSCMTSNDTHFVTGSRLGEMAVWSLDDFGVVETCRFHAINGGSFLSGGIVDEIQSARFVNPFSLMVGLKSSTVARFDFGKGGAVKMSSSWLSNVRCFESVDRDVVALGEMSGDVVLLDYRVSRPVARWGAFCGSPVRCFSTETTFRTGSLIASSNEKLVELDIRAVGRVAREWRAPTRVTRLFQPEDFQGGRKLVAVFKGALGASVWDLAYSSSPMGVVGSTSAYLPKERLRAFTGFEESSSAAVASGGAPSSSATGASVVMSGGGGSSSIAPSLQTSTERYSDSSFFPAATTANASAAALDAREESFGSWLDGNLEELDSLAAIDPREPFLYFVRGTHKIARVPLKLHEAPLEVRVKPLCLNQIGTNRRYKPGQLCLTAGCVIAGQILVVAGHENNSNFDGGFVHALI